jgi:hypothetical protein
MTPAIFAIVVGTFGAILQELLVWYNARKKLETEECRALFASTKYWTVVTAMAIGAGIAAWVWFYPDQQAATDAPVRFGRFRPRRAPLLEGSRHCFAHISRASALWR